MDLAALRDELSARPIRVIVLGASAGGIEALGALLPSLPRDLPAALAAVIHLPAERPSLLAEIFAHKCAIAVREASDKEPLAPGALLFAPPDYHLHLERDGVVSLSADAPVHYSRPSIDVLFESAAWAYGRHALGVLLSGANADGAEGLAAIRARGGLAWAQDPETAAVSTMPLAAIARGAPHHVLTLGQMAEVLGGWRPLAHAHGPSRTPG